MKNKFISTVVIVFLSFLSCGGDDLGSIVIKESTDNPPTLINSPIVGVWKSTFQNPIDFDVSSAGFSFTSVKVEEIYLQFLSTSKFNGYVSIENPFTGNPFFPPTIKSLCFPLEGSYSLEENILILEIMNNDWFIIDVDFTKLLPSESSFSISDNKLSISSLDDNSFKLEFESNTSIPTCTLI